MPCAKIDTGFTITLFCSQFFSAGSYFTSTETGEIVLDTKLACLIMFQSLLRVGEVIWTDLHLINKHFPASN